MCPSWPPKQHTAARSLPRPASQTGSAWAPVDILSHPASAVLKRELVICCSAASRRSQFQHCCPILRVQPRCAGSWRVKIVAYEFTPHRDATQVSVTRAQQSAGSSHGKLAALTWPLLLTITLMLLLSVASI